MLGDEEREEVGHTADRGTSGGPSKASSSRGSCTPSLRQGPQKPSVRDLRRRSALRGAVQPLQAHRLFEELVL